MCSVCWVGVYALLGAGEASGAGSRSRANRCRWFHPGPAVADVCRPPRPAPGSRARPLVPVAAGAVRVRHRLLLRTSLRTAPAGRRAACHRGAGDPRRRSTHRTSGIDDGGDAGRDARAGGRKAAHGDRPRTRAAGPGRAHRHLRPPGAGRAARRGGPAPHYPRHGDGKVRSPGLAGAGARAHDGGERSPQARRPRARQGHAQPAAGAGAAGRL